MVMDSGEDYIATELSKTKRKLREITAALETQHQFLRLIVQVTFNYFEQFVEKVHTFLFT